jgi:hypothetical protein
MAFELTANLRERLRTVIVAKFTRETFLLFANDKLEVKDYRSKVREAGFEVQVHEFLVYYEAVDLVLLCEQLKLARPRDADVATIVSDVLTTLSAYAGAKGNKKSFLVGGRLFLNREELRDRMDQFAGGAGLERLLIISGEKATGKSHSSVLITHHVDAPVKVFAVDLPATAEGELEANVISHAITIQMWSNPEPRGFDDLKQDARDGKLIGDDLVRRLSTLPEQTLLLVDNFGATRLSPRAKDLLIRLCRALERRECPNLWLVLIGLDVLDLAPNYDGIVEPDYACPPDVDDIADFLIAIAAPAGKNLSIGDVRSEAIRIAGILGAKPTYESWKVFERELKQVSAKLKKGDPGGG